MRQTDYIEDSGNLPAATPADQPVANYLDGQSGLSSRLYNADLAPTNKNGRQWSAYSIFALWANDVHNLGNYAFAIGLFSLGWATFLLLWAIQLVIVSYGMEMIRKYEAIAGPVILMTFSALASWILVRAKFSIAWEMSHALSGTDMWIKILGAAALWVSVYGTFILNFCDFTRAAQSRNSIFWGNFWGIPINMLLFGGIVVVLTGGQYHIDGHIIASPADIVAMIPNTFLLVLATLSLLILTVGVNLMANFVAPTYALTNLMPKYMNFRKAAILSALIGLLILPWNLYNSPLVIPIFLGGLGALLGPLFGIIMIDYWIIRKQKINIPALYSDDAQSEYHYMAGSNPRAIIALMISGGLALGLTFLPLFAVFRDFSWFMAAGLGGMIYFLIADRRGPFTDVDGEKISVPACH